VKAKNRLGIIACEKENEDIKIT